MDDDNQEMLWETHARQAVESAMADAEFDELRGVIILKEDGEPHGSTYEFSDYQKLYYHLIEIGESEWVNNVPFDGGEAVFEPRVDGFVDSVLDEHEVEAFFDRTRAPDDSEALFIARDEVVPAGSAILLRDTADIDAELIRFLAAHPEKMHELTPRKFEELIAQLFKDKGYDVQLTPASKDGGFDMRAISKSDIGQALTLIECKKWKPGNPVGVEIVRGLYGVVDDQRATKGLIVTTSGFTSGAKSFQSKHNYRMELAGYDRVTSFLKEWRKFGGRPCRNSEGPSSPQMEQRQ